MKLDERPEAGTPWPRLRGADLPLLVSLDVLLEECNVTRAAARLHLSQPALSARLARLRQMFGDPLLLPAAGGRGLVRSPFARALQQRLRPALLALSGAVRTDLDGFEPGSSTRRFRIAADGAAALMLLPPLYARLRAAGHGGLRLSVADPDPALLAGQMEKGDVDLCILPDDRLPPGLAGHALPGTPYVLAQRPGHPRGRGRASLDECCGVLEHVAVTGLHAGFDAALRRLGRARPVALALDGVAPVAGLLRASDLVCPLPERLAAALEGKLELAALDAALPDYRLRMAWHARGEDDPGLAWLRAEIDAVLATPAARPRAA